MDALVKLLIRSCMSMLYIKLLYRAGLGESSYFANRLMKTNKKSRKKKRKLNDQDENGNKRVCESV